MSEDSFKNPPPSSRPMTWMHVMNGNASVEGMEKDIDALADAGVGGALLFSIGRKTPKGNVAFNSPEFDEVLSAAVKRAAERGLVFGLHNCDGWTSSGGPWITPDLAMKRVVWSSTVVQGPVDSVTLPEPAKRDAFYRDIAVVAIPASQEELLLHQTPSTLTLSDSTRGSAALEDGDLDNDASLPVLREHGGVGWLQREFNRPVTVASIRVEHLKRDAGPATILASDDGETFRHVATVDRDFRLGKKLWAHEASFPPHTAKFFRVEFTKRIQVVEFDLDATPRLSGWLAQTGVSHQHANTISNLVAREPSTGWVSPSDVLALPSVDKNGAVQADLPDGRWRLLRFGYTTTGARNSPATTEGVGLECDKLDAAAIDLHFNAYVGRIAERCGELTGPVLRYAEIDSYEMGGQNWTRDLRDRFREKKGYDLTPWLPLVAGFRLGDPSTADAVLGDFRKLLCELMQTNYYERFSQLCHERGMQSYVEPYGFGNLDELTVGGSCDIPMGEFWIDSGRFMHQSAVSSAHTYGKKVVSAEAFTSWADLNWKVHPFLMKNSGDKAWSLGINEFMFHRFAHQANPNVAPGMTMDSIGSHIDRTQTWWLSAGKAWMTYLHRGGWMLRQGTPVSDVLVYVGEAAQHPIPKASTFKLPEGVNFDLCDTHVLHQRVTVDSGGLVLPEGTRYQLLFLSNCEQLSLSGLRRVIDLARAGATVIGPRPIEPIGFLERRDRREEFEALVAEAWGPDGESRRIGSGRVIATRVWSDTCDRLVRPDLLLEGVEDKTFVHRRVGSSDVYFVRNDQTRANRVRCSFRIPNGDPEIWDAATGAITRPAVYRHSEARTEVDLPLDPFGSAFVVFHKGRSTRPYASSLAGPDEQATLSLGDNGFVLQARQAGDYLVRFHDQTEKQITLDTPEASIDLEGSWRVNFQPATDEPAFAVNLHSLADWSEHTDPRIKHFSGTATYTKEFVLEDAWLRRDRRVEIDLGKVEVCCDVTVNGNPLACLWKPPFALDITSAAKAGRNRLELQVTNLWSNRLIGDEALPRTDGYDHREPMMPSWYSSNEKVSGPRSTFTTFPFYAENAPLVPSGLIGPVQLHQVIENRFSR